MATTLMKRRFPLYVSIHKVFLSPSLCPAVTLCCNLLALTGMLRFSVENHIPASAGGVGIFLSALVGRARSDASLFHNMEMLIQFFLFFFFFSISNSGRDRPPPERSSLGSAEPYQAFHLSVLNQLLVTEVGTRN